jgi:hypothetical protein
MKRADRAPQLDLRPPKRELPDFHGKPLDQVRYSHLAKLVDAGEFPTFAAAQLQFHRARAEARV